MPNELMDKPFLTPRYRILRGWVGAPSPPAGDADPPDPDRDLIEKTFVGQPFSSAARLYNGIRAKFQTPQLREVDLELVRTVYSAPAEAKEWTS